MAEVDRISGVGRVLETLADPFTTCSDKEQAMPNQTTPARRPYQSRHHNGNWKGGRVIASNGYILIKVGFDHHLADVRGYAYEHRVVAEQMLGRQLLPNEQVHHKNEIKSDNRPENLEVKASIAEHRACHRNRTDLRLPSEPNPDIRCACGCGQTFPKYDDCGRPRKYVSGHNPQRKESSLSAFLLQFLSEVPEPPTTQFMSSFFDVLPRKIIETMSRLKGVGKVSGNSQHWRINNG